MRSENIACEIDKDFLFKYTIDHSNYHNYIDERIFLHTNFLSNPLDTDLGLYLGRRRRLVVIEY